MLTISTVSTHAANLVESIRSDERHGGGDISHRTLYSTDLLHRAIESMGMLDTPKLGTPYRVIFEDEAPPGGRLAVFCIGDDGSMREVGRVVLD